MMIELNFYLSRQPITPNRIKMIMMKDLLKGLGFLFWYSKWNGWVGPVNPCFNYFHSIDLHTAHTVWVLFHLILELCLLFVEFQILTQWKPLFLVSFSYHHEKWNELNSLLYRFIRECVAVTCMYVCMYIDIHLEIRF